MKNIVFIFSGLLAIVQGQMINKNEVYKPRIVNGEDAKLGEIPYEVSLQMNRRHWCGGSILNEYWVVTAAHCADKKLASDIKIIAGTNNLKEVYSLHQAVQIIVHDNFVHYDSIRNDIALVKVVEPFKFSFRIQPAILPKSHAKVKANSEAIVSGWGTTTNTRFPDILQKAIVYISDPQYCSDVMKERNLNIYPTHICARNPSSRRGECNGDSGGPVTVNGVLMGIVSWSIKDPECGSTYYPGVHTRVSEYVDWIHERVK